MPNTRPNIDFQKIRLLDGTQQNAFEEFCCQIARREPDVPRGSIFTRYYGAGGDGGVECVWTLPTGDEWGWQAKFIESVKADQIADSFVTALAIHPKLTRFTICLPFDLTGPTRRRGKSGAQVYADLKNDLDRIAGEQRRRVDISRAGKSELLDALLREPDADIRLRYWFDEKQLLPATWFVEQVTSAARAAEPRYSPTLSVETPVVVDIEAFGRTPAWEKAIKERWKKLEELQKRWDDSVSRGAPFSRAANDFPDEARDSATRLHDTLLTLRSQFAQVSNATANAPSSAAVQSTIAGALEAVRACLPLLVAAVDAKHGAGSANSAGFRQFQAEYMVSFPARHVDAARDIEALLDELASWNSSASAELPFVRTMLLTGDAGMGKTHTVCDVALRRAKSGMPSVVLFGEWFSHTSGEAWQRIAASLGFGDLGRDDLFALLNLAGEISGYPCVLFIDALNETVPRAFWRDSLAMFVAQLERFSWIRVCFTCRSSYLQDVWPSSLAVPIVRHSGFEGIEYEACFAFFRHYKLDAPAMPLLQPEFGNPLFLRIICEALRDSGRTTFPDGLLGLQAAIRFLLDAKNDKLAVILDYHPRERRVQKALAAFVEASARHAARKLPWEEAQKTIDGPWPTQERTKSMFDHLVREGILREERSAQGADFIDEVSVAFERLGDVLLAEALLSGTAAPETFFATGGAVERALETSHNRQGPAEALSIVAAERFGRELPDLAPNLNADTIAATLTALQWRAPSSITARTQAIVQRALGSPDLHDEALEALLSLAARAGNPLNADWFHELAAGLPLPVRDGWLSPYFHRTYGERRGVHRLLQWSLDSDLGTVSDETAFLWGSMLVWFGSASDRRVRDEATIGIVRLMEQRPAIVTRLLQRFAGVNDDYVIERCLAAAYGALLRLQSPDVTRSVAVTTHELFFDADVPVNAMIRDYARLILELALRDGLLDDIDARSFRPPYVSAWPPPWPTPDDVKPYEDSYRTLPKLYQSCFNDDFERYTVQSAIRDYEHGVDRQDVLRWIFMHVLDLGYNAPQIVQFDRSLVAKFGGGRSRPSWAERIGKKYQWIAFYRILGRINDHVKRKRRRWDPPPPKIPKLQAEEERNLDPSVVIRNTAPRKETAWWAPIQFDFKSGSRLSDAEWLDRRDFPSPAPALRVRDPESGREFFVLQAYLDWTDQRGKEEDTRYPYRHVYMQIRSYLLPRRSLAKTLEWLRKKSFMNRWMPEGHDMHGRFLGEYPDALPFRGEFSDERRKIEELPSALHPTVYTISCEHGFDAYQTGMNVFVPSPRLLRGSSLRWNGTDGYTHSDGRLSMYDPSVCSSGPEVFVVDAEDFERFLDKRRLAVLWTALSEKQAITGNGPNQLGYIEASWVAQLRRGHIEVASPVVRRVK